MNEIDEQLSNYLVSLSAKVLKCDEGDVMWESDIDEYGFGSMEVNQFCADLNQYFSVNVSPVVFLEVTSLAALSEYLKKYFFSQLEVRLL